MATNKAGFLSIRLNNANIDKTSNRKNTITAVRKIISRLNAIIIKSDIKNKRIKKSKKDVNFAIRNNKTEKSIKI